MDKSCSHVSNINTNIISVTNLPIVPDAFEQIESFLEAIGLIVLSYNHVVATASHHKYDSSDIWKHNG